MKRMLPLMVTLAVLFFPPIALAKGGHGGDEEGGGHLFSGSHAVAGGTPISGPFAIILIIIAVIISIIVKIMKQSDD